MIAKTSMPFVRAYVNEFNIEGKTITQYCIDFWDIDGRNKDSHYRTFYCDELFFKSKKLEDDKSSMEYMGKMMDIEYKANTFRKQTQDGFSYNLDRLNIISFQPTISKNK